MSRGTCDPREFVCVVVDEAHRALGNHAYCNVVQALLRCTQHFRVVALSATPGSSAQTVQQILNNLLIASIELRSETSLDVREYINDRQVVSRVHSGSHPQQRLMPALPLGRWRCACCTAGWLRFLSPCSHLHSTMLSHPSG